MRANRATLAVLAIGLLCAAATPAMTFLVVESRGAAAGKFPKGTLLDGSSEMDLPASSELVLLSDTGVLRTVRGPARSIGNLDVGAPANPGALKSLGDMLRVQKDGRMTLGAVRGGPPMRPTDPWVIDTTTTGTKCLFEDRPAVLWRSGPLSAARVSLQATGSGDRTSFDWPAKASTVPWPSAVRTKSGETYQLAGNAAESTFTLAVATGQSSPGGALLFMAESQCADQAALLLAELSKAGASSANNSANK
jgi:hypothetical protein